MNQIPKSSPLKRWKCRRVGHDWTPWQDALLMDRRDCRHCAVWELRHRDAQAHWPHKRIFVYRSFFGRLVQWFA